MRGSVPPLIAPYPGGCHPGGGCRNSTSDDGGLRAFGLQPEQ
jgi:hypothetical protein